MMWMIVSDVQKTEGPTPYENSYVQESKNQNQWAHLQTKFSKLQGWDQHKHSLTQNMWRSHG